MRSIKTTGGLTRGRGMTDIQLLVWLLSMPACADVSHSMQEFTSDELSKINEIFMQDQASMNDITKAGENALVSLYNGDSGDDLNALRYKRFQEKVMKSHKYVDASDLPPTSGSAKFHSLRVYYWVQQWKGETGHLNPKQWGWEIINDQLMPMKTDMHLLQKTCCTYSGATARPDALRRGAPARSMDWNAHLHVVNVKDSAVQILQSLWMMVMMTGMIETNVLDFFKLIKLPPLLIFCMIFCHEYFKIIFFRNFTLSPQWILEDF